MTKIVHVAAGVIRDASGLILIAKRPDDAHQGGLWEFPGGKLETGETADIALIRELQEELGITSTAVSPLIQIRHDYADKSVLLDVWNVTAFTGEAHGREGQPVRWVSPATLSDYPFPAANAPIVTAAQLPNRMLITGAEPSVDECLAKLQVALQSGIQLVQLRQKHWNQEQWQSAVPKAAALCREAGARLLVNSPVGDWSELVDGIHLTGAQVKQADEELKGTYASVSASCHSAEELKAAEALGVDFVTLSPVFKTNTHPEQSPLDWYRFEALVKDAKIPVFALGGMSDSNIEESIKRGGQGVAAISAWWPISPE